MDLLPRPPRLTPLKPRSLKKCPPSSNLKRRRKKKRSHSLKRRLKLKKLRDRP